MIGVVAFSQILSYAGQNAVRIVVKCNRDQCGVWVQGFFLKKRDLTISIDSYGTVFAHQTQIAHVIDTDDWSVLCFAELCEPGQWLGEKVIACQDCYVLVDTEFFDRELEVTNRPQAFGFSSRTVADEIEGNISRFRLPLKCPTLKLVKKQCIGHNMDSIYSRDTSGSLENMIDQ